MKGSMMAKQKLSKAQISKEVRRILLKYQTNLSEVYFNAGVSSIILSGNLVKNSGREFKSEEMFNLTNELLKLGHIRCELENWVIGSDGVYFIGEKESKKAS